MIVSSTIATRLECAPSVASLRRHLWGGARAFLEGFASTWPPPPPPAPPQPLGRGRREWRASAMFAKVQLDHISVPGGINGLDPALGVFRRVRPEDYVAYVGRLWFTVALFALILHMGRGGGSESWVGEVGRRGVAGRRRSGGNGCPRERGGFPRYTP